MRYCFISIILSDGKTSFMTCVNKPWKGFIDLILSYTTSYLVFYYSTTYYLLLITRFV